MTFLPATCLDRPPLPDATWRPGQQQAVQAILDHYANGAKVVWLDGPTGAGKSAIGEGVRQALQTRGQYVCSSITLQNQVLHDFPHASLLMGRSNYPTGRYPQRFGTGMHLSCADCNYKPEDRTCSWCHTKGDCPYERAKNRTLAANLAVVNSAYWLAEANGPGRLSGAAFTVWDEADLLENSLTSHIEVHVSQRRRQQLGLPEPARKTVASAWQTWVDEAIPTVATALRRAGDQLPHTVTDGNDATLRAARQYRSLLDLHEKLKWLQTDMPNGDWVYTGDGKGDVTFKPVVVRRHANQYLWRHSKRWLLMSATLISSEQMAADLGLDDMGIPWATVRVPSTFPAANRPVHVCGVEDVTHANREQAWPAVGRSVENICAMHPDERILVHTVSYDLTQFLVDGLRQTDQGGRIVTYRNATERELALAMYRERPGAVMLAPSLDRGVSLDYDDCRIQVICKVPWPYLGDRQVSARLYSPGGRTWYLIQAIRSLVQASGRGMRAEDDTCETYIVDRQFARVWKEGRHLFPEWFRDAVHLNSQQRSLVLAGT